MEALISIEDFKTQLGENDFIELDNNETKAKQIQFIGQFEGNDVIWHANIYSLLDYNQEFGQQLNEQLLDVKHYGEDHYHINVVLKVPQISDVSKMMTIKMVRQYKALKLGVHRWNFD